MARETTNYGLIKPTPEEFYDVEVSNDNMDKIDAAIALAAESGGSSEETLAKLDEVINEIQKVYTALQSVEVSYPNVKSGEIIKTATEGQATETVTFDFKEIDLIVNDADEDVLALTIADGQTFKLNPGESINDVSLRGSSITFSGASIKARYILLG